VPYLSVALIEAALVLVEDGRHAELAEAATRGEVVHETADLLYMALVALVRRGGSLTDVRAELARRHAGVTRRPMTAKAPADAP